MTHRRTRSSPRCSCGSTPTTTGYRRPRLHSLESLGVDRIDLDYRLSGRRDRHGNLLRYRCRILGWDDSNARRWAYGVIFR